jgi:uncharacterized membrane protein YfcA
MQIDIFSGEFIGLAGLLIFGGIVTGLLSGLFGVGGGGILVPVLYELFGALGTPEDVRMHLAVGTSFAVILPTSFRAARSHYDRGAIDGAVLPLLGMAAVFGVILGSVTAKYSDDAVMKIVWVISATLMSASLIFRRESWRIAGHPERPAWSVPIGVVVGFLATLMGIGGGAYITLFLALFGRSMHVAVGTSAAFSAIVAVPAVLGYVWAGWGVGGLPAASLGYVSLIGAAILIPTSVLAAPFGVGMAHGLSKRKLEIGFSIFLLSVGGRFLLALAN